MRVLGIDPGLTRCGLGVVEGSVGRPLRMVAVDVVRTAPDAPLGRAARRGRRGHRRAGSSEHAPDVVAVERVFSQHNVRTVMGTAQVSGVALVAAGPPRHTPGDAHAERGQGRRDRQRPGRQGAGRPRW